MGVDGACRPLEPARLKWREIAGFRRGEFEAECIVRRMNSSEQVHTYYQSERMSSLTLTSGTKERPPSSATLRRKAAGVRPKYVLN